MPYKKSIRVLFISTIGRFRYLSATGQGNGMLYFVKFGYIFRTLEFVHNLRQLFKRI